MKDKRHIFTSLYISLTVENENIEKYLMNGRSDSRIASLHDKKSLPLIKVK